MARWIGQDMEPGLHDVKLDREMVVDLALSAAGAVMWRLDFTTERLSWTSGLESMLGMASAHPHAVQQDDRVVYVNTALIPFLRAGSAAEILGRPIVDFVHPDSVPDMLRRIQSLTTPGATSAPAEATLLRFDGGTVDIESISVRT